MSAPVSQQPRLEPSVRKSVSDRSESIFGRLALEEPTANFPPRLHLGSG
jgi:hypothetical protein